MNDFSEEFDMALMRVRRAAQLTLPADLRRALNVKEGDYLEARVVKNGVLLKPVSVVERKRAWQEIQRATSHVRDLKPKRGETHFTREEAIAKEVKASRWKHA
jgi:AbrB family looped-hinge helix DNA binding protein